MMAKNIKHKVKSLLKGLLNLKRLWKKIPLEESILKECANVLPPLACIDVGASYYAHPAWEVFRNSPNTLWIACDPCQENLNYIKNWHWLCSVEQIPLGLSQQGGQQLLYVTATDSGSSLLPPEISSWISHRVLTEYFFPIMEKLVDTITLSDIIQQKGLENKPILIKLDTQGTEFSILQNLYQSEISHNLVAVEIEISLQAVPIMKGSNHFYEVQKFFEDMGFELACLKPIEGILPKFNPKIKGKSILNECDAVFILRPDAILKKCSKYQLAILGVYIAYQLYGEALHLIGLLLDSSDLDEYLKKSLSNIAQKLKE